MNHLPPLDPLAAGLNTEPSQWVWFADCIGSNSGDWIECAGELLLQCLSSLLD